MRLAKLGIIILLLLISVLSTAQDVGYSQYYGNPVYLNPSLAGNKMRPRITLNYRNEWPAIDKGYVSYHATWDQHIEVLSGALAVMVSNDVAGAGVINKLAANAVYAFQLKVSENISASAALQAGYFQYKLDWDKLIFSDQIIPGTGEIIPSQETRPSKLTISDVDFSAGFNIGYKQNFYLGGAVHHLTMPNISFYTSDANKMDMRITVHAGGYISLIDGSEQAGQSILSISPNTVYIQQGHFKQMNTGAYVNFYPFVAGLWHRYCFENPDALIVLLGFEQPQYKIGYSFDYTLSKVSIKSGGAHEISFTWLFPYTIKKEFKYKAIKCPTF